MPRTCPCRRRRPCDRGPDRESISSSRATTSSPRPMAPSALDEVARQIPDAIVCDLMMPVTDGLHRPADPADRPGDEEHPVRDRVREVDAGRDPDGRSRWAPTGTSRSRSIPARWSKLSGRCSPPARPALSGRSAQLLRGVVRVGGDDGELGPHLETAPCGDPRHQVGVPVERLDAARAPSGSRG